jgi:hypothetical protein
VRGRLSDFRAVAARTPVGKRQQSRNPRRPNSESSKTQCYAAARAHSCRRSLCRQRRSQTEPAQTSMGLLDLAGHGRAPCQKRSAIGIVELHPSASGRRARRTARFPGSTLRGRTLPAPRERHVLQCGVGNRADSGLTSLSYLTGVSMASHC